MNSSHYIFAETLSDKVDDYDSDNNNINFDPEADENVYNECFPQTTNQFNDMTIENSHIEKTLKTFQTMSEEFNKIIDQNKKLQDENNKLKEDCDNLYREKMGIERN